MGQRCFFRVYKSPVIQFLCTKVTDWALQHNSTSHIVPQALPSVQGEINIHTCKIPLPQQHSTFPEECMYKGDQTKGKRAFVEQFPYSTFSSCTYISSIHLYFCCGWALHWNISFSSPLYLQRKTSLKLFQFCWNFFWSDFSLTVCFHFFTEDLHYVRCLVASRAPWLPKTMLL